MITERVRERFYKIRSKRRNNKEIISYENHYHGSEATRFAHNHTSLPVLRNSSRILFPDRSHTSFRSFELAQYCYLATI